MGVGVREAVGGWGWGAAHRLRTAGVGFIGSPYIQVISGKCSACHAHTSLHLIRRLEILKYQSPPLPKSCIHAASSAFTDFSESNTKYTYPKEVHNRLLFRALVKCTSNESEIVFTDRYM